MTFLTIISYIGVFVFALTGAFKARSYKMDIFGGLVLAFVTAYGGGTLRDLLIGRTPVNWINDNVAFFLVLSGTVFTFLLKEGVNNFQKTIFITDAIGLGLFTASGIEVAMSKGVNEIYAMVLGVVSATFGGLIADLFSSVVPNVLKRGEIYATACAVGGIVYLLLKQIPIDNTTNLLICVVLTAGIRVYSKRKKLTLPGI
jgi:uncharacterized membrane protein YeiH